MSRPIKFRAWHPKHGMFTPEQMSEDQLTLDVNGRGLVNVHSADVRLSEFYAHMTPMQFTGLKDKNGVEIYEGDIILDSHFRDPTVIEFLEQHAMFGYQRNGRKYYLAPFRDSPIPVTYEVIGNIHKNPELQEHTR